jgi:tRNAThr (cytosine32-N3)-methyltransferase
MAQLRFKKERLLEDSLYVRGDGTRVYFFTNEEITGVFAEFKEISNGMDRRLLVNRFKKIKMYRCWVQAKYQKPF